MLSICHNSVSPPLRRQTVLCSTTMGVYYGLVVLVGVTLQLTNGQSEPNCRGVDGQPGEAGINGRNGLPGSKGEKGLSGFVPIEDPGVPLRLNGDTGGAGPQGVMGPKGYRGEVGPVGLQGNPGPRGLDGRTIGIGGPSAQQTHSAFSVIRTSNRYPPFNWVVTYEDVVVNTGRDFDATSGEFTCRVPGVYYFSFHSVAKVSICLKICSDALGQSLGFCHYNRNINQVLSGGVVLQLTAGQKVHLKSFKENQGDADAKDTQEKRIIFNGFLLFSN